VKTADVTTRRATLLVAERELREALRRRSLWIVLGLLFVGASVAMILPTVLDSGTTRYDVGVVGPSEGVTRFERAIVSTVESLGARARVRVLGDVDRARGLVDDGELDLAVVLDRRPTVIVRAGEHTSLVGATRQALASNALAAELGAAGLAPHEAADLLDTPPPRIRELDVEGADRRAGASVVSLVLYLVLLMLMIQAANGVAIEKANRISEVLLAVVKPGALLFGKIIGVGIVGLLSLAAGAIPVVVKAAAGGDLPAGLGPALAGGAPWFVLGIALYLTIAGSLGALVERQEEAGSVLTPLSLLLVATYLVAQTAAANPSFADSWLGTGAALFPLTSPVVMPARIALGDASPAEIILSVLLLAVSVVVVARVGAAIYRRGIVSTGRRLRLGEALRAP
jgi:ABC-2 type transport system permease protein